LPLRLSVTYDQGREMTMKKELSKHKGIAVYFCGPNSPWQRGLNEKMNRLVKQYLPKGTELAVYSLEKWTRFQTKSTTSHAKV
jgi:IS30 family transposase